MVDESFIIIDIPSDNNSQFASIGWYTNESHEVVRQNIIEELTLYKSKYIQLFKQLKFSNPQSEPSLNLMYNNYINSIQNNGPGDDITLLAASNFYNINICLNENTKLFVDEVKPIDLYLESNGNHYNVKIKYNNDNEIDDKINNEMDNEIDDEINNEMDNQIIKYITVFDDPVKYNVEHSLDDNWTLWVNNIDNPKSQNWLDTIIKLISINSIEKFWCMYNNIPLPSQLIVPSDFYLFKNDIIQMWEDDNNKNGGKITIILKKNTNIELLNNLWLNTLLACIGNNFYDDEYDINPICGIVLNIRKHQNRINIWINTSDEQSVNNIISKWTRFLDTGRNGDTLFKINMSFVKHNEQTDSKK